MIWKLILPNDIFQCVADIFYHQSYSLEMHVFFFFFFFIYKIDMLKRQPFLYTGLDELYLTQFGGKLSY
jgi:hypothetical protein